MHRGGTATVLLIYRTEDIKVQRREGGSLAPCSHLSMGPTCGPMVWFCPLVSAQSHPNVESEPGMVGMENFFRSWNTA